MADTPYHRTLKDLTTAQKQTNENLLKINESIKTQMSGVAKAVKEPPPTNVEEKKEKKAENKKFLDELKSIIGSAVGGAGGAGKEGASMLGKFLKIGLAAAVVPFLGLIGGVVGVISGIMATPEFKFLKSIFSGIGKATLGFIKTMGSIGKWFLNLMPGGKLGTKLGEVFGSLGKTMSGMFKGWTGKIATFLENPKIVKVMEKVSKFIKPFTRLALWLFAGYEFIQGWGKADEIFGKKEGDATIIEKFASGIGGVLEFLSFGLVSTEKAAKGLKATFDFFKLAVTKPKEAWKKVTDWWTAWDFNKSIVEPMVKMFDDFPKKVREFIDGPLSDFGSKATTMLKDFVFGKKDPDAKEGDAKDGGLWGGIKSLFSVENVTKAIKGFAKLTIGFAAMLGSLVSIPLIGTKGNWTDLKSWGGLLGWIKDDLMNWENIKAAVVTLFATMKSIGSYVGAIGGNLITSLMDWIGEKFEKFKIGDKLKNAWDKAVAWIEKKFDFKMPEFKIPKFEMPDWDPIGSFKDLIRPLLEKASWLVPPELLDWVKAKKKPAGAGDPGAGGAGNVKEKTVAEKLAETHPGKMTYADFLQSEEYKSTVRKDDGSLKGESDKKKERKYQSYLGGGVDLGQLLKTGLMWDKSQTRASSLTGMDENSQSKLAVMGNLFASKGWNSRLTSGFRDAGRGNKAMLNSADGMRKYKKKWRDMLTDEQLDSKPGSKERQSAIDTMRAGGFGSQHEHGNAIDFSYPIGYSKKNFSELKTTLLGAFPGATIVGESDHVHMAFNKKNSGKEIEAAYLKNNSGQLLSQAQAQSQARVNRGAGNTTIIKGGDSSQSVHHSVGTSSHDQHAKPEEVIGQN